MKQINSHSFLPLLFACLFSCKKDPPVYLDTANGPAPIYHVSFYDHKTGEKITGLEAAFVRYNSFNDYITNSFTVKSDAKGELTFNPYCRCTNQYLKISEQSYIEALYEVNDLADTIGKPLHTSGGSSGANVVYTRLLRKEGSDFYFRTDLYRKAPVDFHIRQVSDYSDTILAPIFNAAVFGTDPSNSANIFETHDLFGKGLQLSPDRKIDTTIRVYAYGDYLNKVSWGVYQMVDDFWEGPMRMYINKADLEVKIFPSDTLSGITITF